jgi:hypothetical protein
MNKKLLSVSIGCFVLGVLPLILCIKYFFYPFDFEPNPAVAVDTARALLLELKILIYAVLFPLALWLIAVAIIIFCHRRS